MWNGHAVCERQGDISPRTVFAFYLFVDSCCDYGFGEHLSCGVCDGCRVLDGGGSHGSGVAPDDPPATSVTGSAKEILS
ncbi:hypothetical protein NUU61_000663 [Penicillium alfredii]|uniref:Uncharacterized protein n=1 Tax=Penicillium alfredii TaxID=1506179 RepID=A0A9W9GAF4_9EURO|nr:uncharacterized protein NUU61_000663 [Penicillium alfredii]KAJ5114904.1 hypothetical protein NUU61_000663 [Penicillium alfredii]